MDYPYWAQIALQDDTAYHGASFARQVFGFVEQRAPPPPPPPPMATKVEQVFTTPLRMKKARIIANRQGRTGIDSMW